MRRGIALLSLLACGAFDCQVVAGYEGFEHAEATDAAPAHRCDVLKMDSKLDEKQLVKMQLVKKPEGDCFWIDSTEVTVKQYDRFLNEHAEPVAWENPRCAWKQSLSDPKNEPGHACTISTAEESGPFTDDKPIRCVDWCDARAFCKWAGKDLCEGSSNNGVLEPLDSTDQWGAACGEGGLPFPYGAQPVGRNCNIGLSEDTGECKIVIGQLHCGPTQVGSFPACKGASGTLDMVGNVAEWVVNCAPIVDAGTAASSNCALRGGSFADDAQQTGCLTMTRYAAREARERTIGLRCCAALTTAEQAQLP